MDTKFLSPEPQNLSPSSSGRRRSSGCNSPEFEFWVLRNPSFPQPNLLSADELFSDGVLLPLHFLSTHNKPDPPDETLKQEPEKSNSEPPASDPRPEPSPAITDSTSATLSASKRWKDIFRRSDKKNAENSNLDEEEKEKDKGKKKQRKNGSGASSAELNINIWPFSRSRSAGNSGTRPKFFGVPGSRKVNSAPCSRSNSTGESNPRKWPSSPGRAGVHVGRSSPVWQVRRGGTASKNSEPQALSVEKRSKRETSTSSRNKSTSTPAGGGGKAGVLNLNVPKCVGYRPHLNCRSDENSSINVSGGTNSGDNVRRKNDGSNGGNGNDGGSNNLFNLRTFFTKKCVVTSH